MLTQSKRYITRSGKEIQIMANPHLSAADFKLEIECNDKYYQNCFPPSPNTTYVSPPIVRPVHGPIHFIRLTPGKR